MPRITDFCDCTYALGCKLSRFRFCDNDFGITPVDNITIGITFAAFCFHITHSTYFMRQFLGFVLFVDYCFGQIMCIQDSHVYQKGVPCFFLFMKVTSGLLEYIVLSVIMMRFQYSFKLSFSSTLVGVYL
jgi:hypothetical protein